MLGENPTMLSKYLWGQARMCEMTSGARSSRFWELMDKVRKRKKSTMAVRFLA